MRKLLLYLAVISITFGVFAQVPQKMSYQAVIRNASNVLVTSHAVGMRISILQGSVSGTVVYSETQTPTTNANGLVSIEIGGGTGFDAINWASGPYFIKTETDPTGGTSYTISGTSQLLSVPYALHSKTAASYSETDPVFNVSPAGRIISENISNWNTAYGWGNHAGLYRPIGYIPAWSEIISKPTTLAGYGITDAATKAYVDILLQRINELETLTSKVKDADGNLYSVVKIGTHLWMAENLKTTRDKNGTAIPLVTDNTTWSNLTTPGYCWYNNNEASYKNTWGALYNWYMVNTGNLCPAGWHVPTDVEWTTLTAYLGGTNIAGGKLKETGTTHWTSPNTGATNETGFTALPGGSRGFSGTFNVVGDYGYWWSVTEGDATNAWFRLLSYSGSSVGRNYSSKYGGFSVRCLKD